MSDSLVFAVGHLLGPFYAGPGALPAYYRIRVGHEVVRLFSDEEFAAWNLARGLPDVAAGEGWTIGAMRSCATGLGLPDLGDEFAQLSAAGVVVESGPDPTVEFARRYRLCPLGLGLGADADRPDMFGIGFLGRPVVDVDRLLYDAWQFLCGAPSLLDGSRTVSLQDEPLSVVVRQAQALTAIGVAYLDVAGETPT
ncbi:hypothetical protein [Dactylosporangium sp. CA-092794]|uniref:hypothetical protein n=1 Tax=Dactylosporangium sp. CA-092794 TaxID=3239929 RepID=UPI003D8D0818